MPVETAQPGISVVTPAYNAERTLERALRSALRQSCPPLEVIVIDDGSTDATGRIAGSFGARVRCVRQENAGVAAARNRAIEAARGDFLAFLDADDEWLPRHLERAIGAFRQCPDLRWFGAAYRRHFPGGGVRDRRPDERRLVEGTYFADYFRMASEIINFTGTMVVRREVFDEVGGFDPDFRTAEDLDMWFRIGLRYPRIGYSPEIACVYCSTEGSLTREGPTTRMTMELIRRSARRAAELGPGMRRQARPLIRSWLVEVIRHAALAQDRDALRELATSHGRETPLPWRMLSATCRATPRPLWRALVRSWTALRPLRRRGWQAA